MAKRSRPITTGPQRRYRCQAESFKAWKQFLIATWDSESAKSLKSTKKTWRWSRDWLIWRRIKKSWPGRFPQKMCFGSGPGRSMISKETGATVWSKRWPQMLMQSQGQSVGRQRQLKRRVRREGGWIRLLQRRTWRHLDFYSIRMRAMSGTNSSSRTKRSTRHTWKSLTRGQSRSRVSRQNVGLRRRNSQRMKNSLRRIHLRLSQPRSKHRFKN